MVSGRCGVPLLSLALVLYLGHLFTDWTAWSTRVPGQSAHPGIRGLAGTGSRHELGIRVNVDMDDPVANSEVIVLRRHIDGNDHNAGVEDVVGTVDTGLNMDIRKSNSRINDRISNNNVLDNNSNNKYNDGINRDKGVHNTRVESITGKITSSFTGEIAGDIVNEVKDGMRRRLPDVLIVGARKCGTRALLDFLEVHPQVKTAREEVHYFDSSYVDKDLEWYRSQMPLSRSDQVIYIKVDISCQVTSNK